MSAHRRRDQGEPGSAARERLERIGLRPFAVVEERLPTELRAALVSPGRHGAAGLLLLVGIAVAVALGGAWLARPTEAPAPARPGLGRPLAGPTHPAASVPAAARPRLLVHVVGAVRRPGMVELEAGSRVADAVAAVGGLSSRGDAASVNLARPLTDGEQLVVLRRGRGRVLASGTVPPPGGTGTAPAGPVSLNSATLEQLDGLPGIGPVLAQRILDWRAAHGGFSTVEELGEVSGIGAATLSDVRSSVTP